MPENDQHTYSHNFPSEKETYVDEHGHVSLFSDFDIGLFKAGKHFHLYRKLGAHLITVNEKEGVYFSVWAPSASHVSVIGSFNGWGRDNHQMSVRWDGSGIWELFIPGIQKGDLYKFYIRSEDGFEVEKADPFAFYCEIPPRTASIIWKPSFDWSDTQWINEREQSHPIGKALSVYEVHLGAWRKKGANEFLTYNELAQQLPAYCKEMGFTHVELMPVMEHPFFGSWGYQITGYFAPTSRHGSPEEFMHLVNELHRNNIGVILDWVPSHFPGDQHGLYKFDGSHLFEHPDPRRGFHPDWNSYIFNYGRNEVRSFLVSNALFWLDRYHVDGLRVDAVASMLYLDYSRRHGEWEPNIFGGRENLEAVDFLQTLNETVHSFHPGVLTIAEESTAYPGVTHPVGSGGLGFDIKWMMGWMNDTLAYFSKDPIYRGYHQNDLIFSLVYAFSEKFLLPLSHDEVVYGKGSMINRMPGDEWQKFANLRLLYTYMFGHPGAKMLFMGDEFGQWHEWKHDYSLDWHLTEFDRHKGLQQCVKELNRIYQSEPALSQRQFSWEGFEWIDFSDHKNSVIAWIRKGADRSNYLIFIANCTPNIQHNYRIGVDGKSKFVELFNSDSDQFGGSNVLNKGDISTSPIPYHGRSHSIVLTLPPLAGVILKRVG